MPYLTYEQATELERWIDSTSLEAVLESLSDICEQKALDNRDYVNDESITNDWDKAAQALWKPLQVAVHLKL